MSSPRHRAGATSSTEDSDADDDATVVTVDYRFSVMKLRGFLDALSREQEEVVESIGFGGVLFLTRYNKLDRHFSVWLCNQLEVAAAPAAPALFLADGAGAKVPVTARDVHEVLGVPRGERPVGRDPTEQETAAVRRALGLVDPLTLQVAEAVVARRAKDNPSPAPMTQAERDSFVVAFVLLLVEHFFSPGPAVGRRGKVNEQVFHALANPSEVHLYNWAEYALGEFRSCADRVREQITSRSSRISLSGCLLFLQLFYFDRLDLEASGSGVSRQSLPRVADYDHDSLYRLIALDQQPGRLERGLQQFGKLQFIATAPTQDNNCDSSSKVPQQCMNSADPSSEQHENTGIIPVVDEIMDEIEQFKRNILLKISRSGLGSKLDYSTYNPDINKRAHRQPLAEIGLSGGTELWQHEYGTSIQHSTSSYKLRDLNVQNIKQCNITEQKPVLQSISRQTTSDYHDDVVILDSNPFVNSSSSAFRVLSKSKHEDTSANQHQQEVPSKKSLLEFPLSKATKCESYFDIHEASPSSEKKPVVDVASRKTTSDCPDDVIILDSNPFESSTVGSCPANSASRSYPKEALVDLQPRTPLEVSSEKRRPELEIRKGLQWESNDMIQAALPFPEKKPVVQVTSRQHNSDCDDDVVILETNPFECSTVGSCPPNFDPRVQEKSNPREVFSNPQPRAQQEVLSEKTSRSEFQASDATKCESYHDMTQSASHSSGAKEKPVVQMMSRQTTNCPENVGDTNCSESETGYTQGCRSPKTKKQYDFGPSPFEKQLVHIQPPLKMAEACFKWLEACSYVDDQLDWTWVIHEEPTYIEVTGLSIKLQMIRAGELKADVCDLVMRLYRQLDDRMYHNTTESRWRHFLPAEWASLALKHGNKICIFSPTVQSMFSGLHIKYDVGHCRMIIVPVELEGSWSCYAWDFMKKQLNIMDPLLNRNGSNMHVMKAKHKNSAPLLLSALLTCMSMYCNSHGYGYDHLDCDPNSWETNILFDLKGMRAHDKRNTGMYTLFYAREFHGEGLQQTVDLRTIVSLRRDLLYQLLTMHGNKGRPPSIVGCPFTGAYTK
ncbi:hypothetical protein EJB05_30407, partial [Eragrostis curvula]